ncbi:hypothetical protein B0H10DRAFT_2035035 [Mycena sp. CBHHK59/15]|nr:hypothetical protein B0H10DRAFT_2035035 [Mycena sp. CBHHK59/15]
MNRSERSGIAGNRTARKNTAAGPSARTPVSGVYGSDVSRQRSKSRSPSRNGSGSRTDPFTLSTPPVAPTIKRKRSATSAGASDVLTTKPSADDVDRGQRIKPKPLSAANSGQSRVLLAVTSSSSVLHRSKRERERDRALPDYSQRPQLPTNVTLSDEQTLRRGLDKGKAKQPAEAPATYSGPLAAAEYERMRKELEALKKTVHDNKKHMKKQNKTIEELKAQVAAETLAREEQEKQVTALTSKSRKTDELLQTIEASLQCQICIELLSKPYALAPCGHILCLECLQQWFRTAPSADSDEEMEPDAEQEYILCRSKSCPCCRATVVRRPVPVFVVKNVVSVLRAAATSAPEAAQREEEDPWKGLFYPEYESTSEDGADVYGSSSEGEGAHIFDDYSNDDDLDEEEVELAIGLGQLAIPRELARFYGGSSESEEGSASESENEDPDEEVDGDEDADESDSDAEGPYAAAYWKPPAHVVEFENVSNAQWKMQRRGCTPRLIALFDMRYTHEEGLIAHVASLDAGEHNVGVGRNRLFLGWNIDVVDEEGGDAEKAFIARQLRDIRRHPERWILTDRHGYAGRGIMDARRLAPFVEDVEVYDTSDSEAYSNGGDFL